jgi:hypothetical protein
MTTTKTEVQWIRKQELQQRQKPGARRKNGGCK